MSIVIRAIGAISLMLALCGTPFAAAAPHTKASSSGFSEVAGCISGADNLLVSIVVDESLSLRATDPQALRVQGITTAVDSLEQLIASVGRSTNVEVSLSTFARSYDTLVDWRELDAKTAQQMRATATRALPNRDAGDATDYRQALLGAKHQLDVRQSQLDDPNACKLLLWFTDGALDVDAQTDTARQELCQVGGIADAVREDGIAVVALALFTPGAGVTQLQRDQLRAVAEGRGGSATCGTTPVPADSAKGVYLPADDPASLQGLFAGAGALVSGGTEVESVTCPGADCPGGAYRLNIDKGVAGARVLVQGASVPSVRVVSPSGQRLQLTSGQTQEVDNASVSYLVRGQLATINVTFSPYARSRSQWSIRPASGSELGVYWFWGARLELETTEIRAGAKNEVVLNLLDQNGAALSTQLYRGAQPTMSVGGQKVGVRLTPQGTFRGTVQLGVDDLPANMTVTASLTMRSIPSNVLLGPISLSQSIQVTLPPSYPTVSPQELDFGQLEGVGATKATLQLTGSQLGPTKVCVTGSRVTVPGEDPQDLIKPASDCLTLKPDEVKTLDLKLAPDTTVDGVATGKVLLRLSAADGSDDLALAVPTRLEMARHVDEGTRWALIAGLLALAVLFPASLLIGSNLLLARFIMSSTSRTVAKPVKVTPTGLRPLNGSALLEPEDFENVPFSGVRKSTRMPIGNTPITLKARRIVSLKEPQGIATGPAGKLLVSSFMPYRGKVSNEAPTGLGALDATFVIVNPTSATPNEADGTLVMGVPGDVDRQGIKDRAARMSSVPDWANLLAEASNASGVPGSDDSARSSAAREPTEADAPSSTPDDQDTPPDLPWDWSDDETSLPPQEQAKSSRFRKVRRSRSDTPKPPASPTAPTEGDDDFPPLPDFLK